MRVFGFDLLPYPERLDHLKTDGELPYPLPRKHFRPELAVQAYREHLDAWARMEELGFDGIGFNEHHTSPYGLMMSPNIMAAAASQRLRRMQILERPAPPVQPGRHASRDVPAPDRALLRGGAAGLAAPRGDEGAGGVSAARQPWMS